MKKLYRTWGFRVLTLATLAGTGSALGEPAPKLVCDKPTHEFGDVDNTQKIKHDFVIRNEGDATLNISNVKASCGCTVANVSTRLVEPGGTSIISAELNLSGRDGSMNKKITVESNDPTAKKTILSLKGKALSLVSYTPRGIMTPKLLHGDMVTNVITVVSLEEMPLAVTIENAGSKHIRAEVLEPEADKNQVQVRVATLSTLPKGATTGRLALKTNSQARPKINIPFRYNVIGELSVYPAEIAIIPRDRPQTKIISVSPGLVKEFIVEKVIVPDERIEAVIENLKQNRYRIQLRNIVQSELLDGKTVRVVTTATGMELIEIPFKVHNVRKSAQAAPR